MKQVINNKEYKGLINKICRDIANSDWRPDYIAGISRGGLPAAVMISHYLEVPMYTLNVSLRDSAFGPESNLWMAEDAYGYINYEGEIPAPKGRITSDPVLRKKILIVDDINDTGATINWILNDWPSGCLPADPAWEEIWNDSVRFATVVDNQSSKANVPMDYVGMEINKAEKNVWIEFPYEEWWTK